MRFKIISGLLLLAAAPFLRAQMPTDGPTLFTLNCSACHALDTALVGPSLVEIRSLYLNKPDDFLKWANAPGKKRPGAIEMPSMVHVGEPGLREIYQHIMKVADGVKAQKAVVGDPFLTASTQTARPNIQRIFMPNAGPAAIAVALDDQTSLCWDAGSSRLRYAWTGGFIDGFPYWQGNGGNQAKIVGKIRYTEKEPLFAGTPKFLGYDVKAGLPVFHYTIGAQTISESYEALPKAVGFKRSFTLSPAPTAPLVLEFPAGAKVKTTSDAGTWDQTTLTLTPAQAAKFTLTHLFQ
jgi:cytochrome c551/c552